MKLGSRLSILAVLVAFLLGAPANAQGPAEVSGVVSTGLFFAAGAERDVVGASPALQISTTVGFHPRFGAEAELTYAHFFLRESVLPTYANRSGSQVTALGGLRGTTGRLLGNSRPFLAYGSLRAGVTRETLRAASPQNSPRPPASKGAWIGRSLNTLTDSFSLFRNSASTHQWGFVISPKAGLLVRLSGRAALDVAFHPDFIYNKGYVTSQGILTVGVALSSWESF